MSNSASRIPQKYSRAIRNALALPVSIATLLLLLSLIYLNPNRDNGHFHGTDWVILGGMAATALLYFSSVRFTDGLTRYKWLLVAFNGIGMGALLTIMPDSYNDATYPVIIMVTALVALNFERPATYTTIFLIVASHFILSEAVAHTIISHPDYISLPIILAAISETIIRIQHVSTRQISRLEIINEFSRQVSASLDFDQLIPLLNNAIKDALQADTYYVGILEGDHIKLDLFYDDGEYFYDVSVPIAGSLSGWVVRNNLPVFLPDLRMPIDLDGVDDMVIGQERTSLAWMGVPLYVEKVLGIMAVASYNPSAFDQSDLELLENLAQQAGLVLHNAFHHAHVEEQSKLDSMTGVLNHGHLLKFVEESALNTNETTDPLALIMLDVDFFKSYNDTYGHLAGDEVLIQLTAAIRGHIKRTDAVGRWGGEEFTVCLPGATREQACQVAQRIQETMRAMHIQVNGQELPAPTVSQGIAIYPDEAKDVFSLIDLADKRLYIAKQRGRNQIEPDISAWPDLN